LPPATRIVSPGDAASTAAWIVVEQPAVDADAQSGALGVADASGDSGPSLAPSRAVTTK